MKHILCLFFCAFSATVFGQYEQRSTLGMSGSTSEVTAGDKTFYVLASVGQQSVIGTIGNDTYTMRQGFQQPPIRVLSSSGDVVGLEASVYPNPVGTSVTVAFGSSIDTKILTVLYDIQGRNILDLTLDPTHSFQIDMSQLAAGTYILKIWVGDENFSTRLIKN